MGETSPQPAPIAPTTLRARARSLVGRSLRRLARPLLRDCDGRLLALEQRMTASEHRTAAIDHHAHILEKRIEVLCEKIDRLSEKLEAQNARQDRLHAEVAATVALNWDHEAIARRLARIEDRLIATAESSDPPEPAIRFPGLDLFDPPSLLDAATDPEDAPEPRVQAG